MLFTPRGVAQVAACLLLSSIGAAHAISVSSRATTCNGHSELCDKSYGNVTYVGAHNSYAVGTNNLFANQDYDVTQQLNDGVRLLQLQAHNNSGVITLCHSTCSVMNGGTLQAYLTKVKTWLDANANDVVTILIVNIDNLVASEYETVYKAAGVDSVSFSPASAALGASAWPTLGSMIDSGTRLVTFLDNAADFTTVPYLIDEFTNMWETAYDITDIALFDCTVNRTNGNTATQMYLINHFLDKLVFGQPAPDVDKANVTNAASGDGSLGAQVDTCNTAEGRSPNFLLVDWYEFGGGSVFQVAATANGVDYSPSTAIATPVSTTTSSSSSSGSTSSSNTGSSVVELLPNWRQLQASALVVLGVAFGAFTVL